MKYTNKTAVPMSLAVWLAEDSYDYNGDSNTISVTSLLKPARQIVLANRVTINEQATTDISAMIPSSMGTALHTAINAAWLNNYREGLALLGYPQKVIDSIRINPATAEPGTIPIYMEQRVTKRVGNFIVSGKYDFIANGRLEDFKSTSVYTYLNKSNNKKFILQGSMYRWLNPELVTDDHMAIQYIFTDWNKSKSISEASKGYPANRIVEVVLALHSEVYIDSWVKSKLNELTKLWDAPEEALPYCTDEDLWRSQSVFKYYKNPAKTERSTKNFDCCNDALCQLVQDGSNGLVKEIKGQVKACVYCAAFKLCSQKNEYLANGSLII